MMLVLALVLGSWLLVAVAAAMICMAAQKLDVEIEQADFDVDAASFDFPSPSEASRGIVRSLDAGRFRDRDDPGGRSRLCSASSARAIGWSRLPGRSGSVTR